MASELQTTFSNRLKEALSARNMRQSDLCNYTKIPKSAMSQYMSGAFEPKQDRLFLISSALNVDPVWLMGYDVPMELSSDQTNSPGVGGLTEGEEQVLELFRRIPEDRQKEALDLLELALRMQQKS